MQIVIYKYQEFWF